MRTCHCVGVYHSNYCHKSPNYSEPLAPWERELLEGVNRPEGEGDVTFHCKNDVAFTIKNVRVDSISPVATNNGVTTGEFFESDEMFHVPNVLYWTIAY